MNLLYTHDWTGFAIVVGLWMFAMLGYWTVHDHLPENARAIRFLHGFILLAIFVIGYMEGVAAP